MSGYTKGPWKAFIAQSYTLGRGSSKVGPMFQIEAYPQSAYWLAYVQDSPDGCGKGNALIMAAAPELLEALKACHLQLLQSGDTHEYVKEACDLAYSAIAKAEGK